MPNYWETVTVEGDDMAVYVTLPEGDGPFPAVVVLPHAGGVDSFFQDMTRRLSECGYAAACPDMYHRAPVDSTDRGIVHFERLRSDNMIKDTAATVDFLKAHSVVDGQRLGVMGYCGGGQITYLVATAIADFKAACIYHAGHLFEPWADGMVSFDRSSHLVCPLLGHFGEEDLHPTIEEVGHISAELTQLGKDHEFYTYPLTHHGFMAYHRTELYNATSDRASWPRTLDFFHRHLGGPVPRFM